MKIFFVPESSEFLEAASTYQNIWDTAGEEMILAWQGLTGLHFIETEITAKVFEGISRSHPVLKLRASYDVEVKKSILIHELGHRLLGPVNIDSNGLESHKTLFLKLYDVYCELYGEDYANRAVAWESTNLPKHIYKEAWDWALAYPKEERGQIFESRIDRSL